MPFRQPANLPDFSRLLTTLVNSRIQADNKALFETIAGLISANQQTTLYLNEKIESVKSTDKTIVGLDLEFVTRFNNDQIKTLPTTPLAISPQPAPGYRVSISSLEIQVNFPVAYTNIDAAGELYGAWDSTTVATAKVLNNAGLSITELDTLFSMGNRLVKLLPFSFAYATLGLVGDVITIPTNETVFLVLDNAGDLTGGDDLNFLTTILRYQMRKVY